MKRTRDEWAAVERNARQLTWQALNAADPGVGWREAGHASPRQAATTLLDDTAPQTDEAAYHRAVDILAAVLGGYGGSWPDGQRPPKLTGAVVDVPLVPGDYLVQVLGSDPPRARVWTHQGAGVFVGHGGKIRRVAIADALNELLSAAERDEGISRW